MSPLSTEIQHPTSLGFIQKSPARICISASVLTAGTDSLSMKSIFRLFLAFGKAPSHSASAVREHWQRQAHLSALWLTARHIKGLRTSDRGCVVCGCQNWSQRQPFTCQIRSPCDAIKHYGSRRKNGGVVTCTDPLGWFSHRNGGQIS